MGIEMSDLFQAPCPESPKRETKHKLQKVTRVCYALFIIIPPASRRIKELLCLDIFLDEDVFRYQFKSPGRRHGSLWRHIARSGIEISIWSL